MGLYAGLQAFFRAHPALQRRPLFVAGESYAGKFVPSLGTLPVSTTLGRWKVMGVTVCFLSTGARDVGAAPVLCCGDELLLR